MPVATIYDLGSGKIRTVIMVPSQSDVELNVQEGEGWVEGEYMPGDYYVVDGVPTERPESPIVIPNSPHPTGVHIRFENIPPNTAVQTPSGWVTVTSGYLEWGTVEPGTYSFYFDTFPQRAMSYDGHFTAI